MVDGDVDSAEAVTHTRIAVPQSDGTVEIQQVLKALDTSSLRIGPEPLQLEGPPATDDFNYDQMENMSPPQLPPPKKNRVSLIYV